MPTPTTPRPRNKSIPGGGPARKSSAPKSGASGKPAGPPRSSKSSGPAETPPRSPRAAAPKAATPAPRRRSWKRVLLTVLGLSLLSFCGLVGFLDGYGQHDRARKADAIVVLGARVGTDGIAGQVLRGRTQHAVNLYKRGIAPKIIFTGGIGAHPIPEARAAATYARKRGVPSSAIVLESRSTSTWENARFTSWICQERGWKRVVVVSDPYHLWRAKRDFEQVGLVAYTSPATDWQNRYPTRRMWATAREAVLVLRDLMLRP